MTIFDSGWTIDKDGPGQRLVFYLKGCDMRCRWCANPESWSSKPEILFYPGRSNLPFDHVCPRGALNGKNLARDVCDTCETRECVEKWRNRCFELVGSEVSPGEIVEKAERADGFFGENGGVTFGGGEPTLQLDELLETVGLLRNSLIHVTVETNANSREFQSLLGSVDLLICDFKAFSEERHRLMTGITNQRIKDNLGLAVENRSELLIRIPLVPGLNDDEAEMDEMATFLGRLAKIRKKRTKKPLRVEILRMHHLGEPKYQALGLDYPISGVEPPAEERKRIFKGKLAEKEIPSYNT